MKRISLISLLALLPAHLSLAIPMAVDDTYDPIEDQVFTVGAVSGLLINDSSDSGSPEAILQTSASNGSLNLAADGSFTYLPDPNFNGTDSFTYLVRELSGDTQFTIDTANSAVTVTATLNTSFGSDTDSDDTALSGTVLPDLDAAAAPFSSIQITDIDAVLTEAIALNFSFALGLAGVGITSQPDGLSVELLQPGPVSAVDAAGNYAQTNNQLRVSGTVNVTTSGLASGQVPEGDQAIDVNNIFTDFNGTITQSGQELILTTPINFTGSFDVSGNTVDLSLTGNLRATRPVQQLVDSNVATVFLQVESIADAPILVSDRYFGPSNSDLSIPVLLPGGGASEMLVSTGSVWRFLDDGSDLGTNWVDLDFDDGSWTNGPAKLGYGEGDEQTVIDFGGVAANKHITTYFRHVFVVADASVQGSLELQLQRDDGAAVYLNGLEVVRSNLPAAADHQERASTVTGAGAETHLFSYAIPGDLLADGSNILAVEVHQATPTSSDLSFDLALIRHRAAGGVLANDAHPDDAVLVASLHRAPENGSVSVTDDGSFTYTPRVGFAGEDVFVYQGFDSDAVVETELLTWGASWKYLDDGSNQGSNWVAQAYDDRTWARGVAELGYGDTDHVTVVNFIDTTPGDPTNVTKNATTYFRNHFVLGQTSSLTNGLAIRLLRDDAAAIYVNGNEVYRDANLPAAAAFDTYASAGVANENDVVLIPLDTAALQRGTNTIAVEVHQVSPTSSDMAFNLAVIANLRPAAELISKGANWHWLYDGSDQSNAWQQAEYDDSLWLSGPGKLGYGDGDEQTLLPQGTTPRTITAYFRHRFDVADASVVHTLNLDLLRDDGAAVYLNGIEIVRDNLAAGASYTNRADAGVSNEEEGVYLSFRNIDPALLLDGENLLAVEVHQSTPTSSDLAFDLQLNATAAQSLGIARVNIFDAGGFLDRDADAMDDHWETLHGLNVGVNDAGDDGDGDRASNLHEYYAATLPGDAQSVLAVTSIVQEITGDYTFRFPTVIGKTYRLQFSPTAAGEFVDVPGTLVVATMLEQTVTIAPVIGRQKGYWRIAVF